MTDKMNAEELAIQFGIVRTSEVHATRLAASIKIRAHIVALASDLATEKERTGNLVFLFAQIDGLKKDLATSEAALAKMTADRNFWKGCDDWAEGERKRLRGALDETLKALIEAQNHIRNDLQPEFELLAEEGRFTWVWPSEEYNEYTAARRLATWWHGCGTDETIERARQALSDPLIPIKDGSDE